MLFMQLKSLQSVYMLVEAISKFSGELYK